MWSMNHLRQTLIQDSKEVEDETSGETNTERIDKRPVVLEGHKVVCWLVSFDHDAVPITEQVDEQEAEDCLHMVLEQDCIGGEHEGYRAQSWDYVNQVRMEDQVRKMLVLQFGLKRQLFSMVLLVHQDPVHSYGDAVHEDHQSVEDVVKDVQIRRFPDRLFTIAQEYAENRRYYSGNNGPISEKHHHSLQARAIS